MAVEYIYRHRRSYDVVWWIQATQETQIRASFTELARCLGLPGAGEAGTAVPAVREALRLGRPYRRWLLVFDSAEDPDLVRPFFPVDGPGQILVTTHNPSWASVARPLEVGVFERAESKELLGRSGIVDPDADKIADKLGDLPLAVDQAACWLAGSGMPAAEYLALCNEKIVEILGTSAPIDYETSVAAAWNAPLAQLSESNPGALLLLQVCAFFASGPVSRRLFTEAPGLPPELAAVVRDPMLLGQAIRDISRYGLAEIDHGAGSLSLHLLVQAVLRNRMNDAHRLEMRHCAHLLLAGWDPGDPASPSNWPRYRAIWRHVEVAELAECRDPRVRRLVAHLFAFLHHSGEHRGAISLAKRAVRAWAADREQRLSAGEKPAENLGELSASERLAFYLWCVGQYDEAAEVARQTLDRYAALLGPDHSDTLNAKLTYALILKARGEFAEARNLNEMIHLKARDSLSAEHPFIAAATHEFAVALLLTGEYEKARILAKDAYERRAENFGADHVNTLATRMLLLLARREAGDYAGAAVEAGRIVERTSRLDDENSADLLRRRYFLSVTLRKSGDHDTALELSGDALPRFRVRYGRTHPNAVACALGHAIDLRCAGKLAEALELGEEVLGLYRQALGETHPHTLSAALDLGVTLRLGGNPARARVEDELSLQRFRERLGVNHPHSIACGINVASDLYALERVTEAAVLDSGLLDKARHVLGEDHPMTLAVQLNRSLDLRELGENVAADSLRSDVLMRHVRVLGSNHPNTESAARGVRADCDIDPMPL